MIFEGYESCELVGAYLLYLIKEEFRDTCDFGLYRDDDLGVSKATLRQTDLIKKKLCTIFSKNGLRITIDVNKHTVNFLDVTLDLKNGTHRPFSKPGNIPLYGMFPGLEKGLCVPFFKSRVTSRKLTVCLLTSIVILRPFLLKMVQSFFLIRSVCLGVALETPRPSSL